MDSFNEKLFAYRCTLGANIITLEKYQDFINQILEEELVIDQIELICAMSDVNKTIMAIDQYLMQQKPLDLMIFGQCLSEQLYQAYINIEDFTRFASMCYPLWLMLPSHIALEEPFLILSYADDPLSYQDEKQSRALYETFFTYYQQEV